LENIVLFLVRLRVINDHETLRGMNASDLQFTL
jgi:hypothetical protein